jgi:hypothetical protein
MPDKDSREEEPQLIQSKEEKGSSLGISLECVPVLEKEKISLGEEVF